MEKIVDQYLRDHVDRRIQTWLVEAPDQDPEECIEQILNNQPAEFRNSFADAQIRQGLWRYLARNGKE